MRNLMMVWMLLMAVNTVAQSGTGDVVGTFVNFATQTPVVGAKAIIRENGRVYLALSNEEGRFRIVGLPAGTYQVVGYFQKDSTEKVVVEVPVEAYGNAGIIYFQGKTQDTKAVRVGGGRYEQARIRIGETPVTILTAKEIKNRPDKFSVVDMVANSNSDIKKDEDGGLMFRGARKGDMIYVLDGIKSNEVFNVPSCAIGRVTVYTGGLPAKYGDTLGGAVILETKSYFDLYREWEINQPEPGQQ
ncbi:MAG: TonB-dependent receptor plug domain-containing protein [Sphingomonadales bacterium]